MLIVTHKGDFQNIIETIWSQKGLKLFANFYVEEEIKQPLLEAGFREVEVFARPAYYEFPKERLIAKAVKR